MKVPDDEVEGAAVFQPSQEGRKAERARKNRNVELYGHSKELGTLIVMAAPQDRCWLCNKFGTMTKEHIPPKSAFNDFPILLLKVDERSNQTSEMEWVRSQHFNRGMYVRSVCASRNNRCGSKYGSAYVNLVRRVAERIGDVQAFHIVSILGVKRPLAILKQVLFQFVSTNGSGFVRANDWVAPFIRSKTNQSMPPDIGIYLFASNSGGAKRTGISSHIDLSQSNQMNVVAEFSFWPLGTVMSFGHLSHPGLVPIHQWVQHRFECNGSVDLHLPVNPIHSPYPLDFRSKSQIDSGYPGDKPDLKLPSEEDGKQMAKEVARRSGTDERDFIFSGHPSTVRKMAEQGILKSRSKASEEFRLFQKGPRQLAARVSHLYKTVKVGQPPAWATPLQA